jgi:hypothetical protein
MKKFTEDGGLAITKNNARAQRAALCQITHQALSLSTLPKTGKKNSAAVGFAAKKK